MNQLSTWTCYTDMDQEIAKQMENVATGFIYLGYLFKQARDTKYYEEAGYQSVYEYAQEKYNITRTQALRFMQINDVYSIDGYSKELAPQYIGYGSSKLTEMLGIPEEIREEIPADTTVKEIRTIKATVAAGIEENSNGNNCATVAQTLINTEQTDDLDMVHNITFLFFKTCKEEFKKFFSEVKEGTEKDDMETTTRKDRLLCALAPSKFAVKRTDSATVMIATTGIKLMPYGKDKINLSMEEFIEIFKELFPNLLIQSAEDNFWDVYQEPLEEPVPEPEPKKESKQLPKEEKKVTKVAAVLEETDTDDSEGDEDDSEDEEEVEAESTETEHEDITEPIEIPEAAGLDLENHEIIIGIDYAQEESQTGYMDPPEKVECEVIEEPMEDSEDSCMEVMDLEDLHEWVITKENMDTEMTNLISYIQEAMKWHESVAVTGKVR